MGKDLAVSSDGKLRGRPDPVVHGLLNVGVKGGQVGAAVGYQWIASPRQFEV
ncbi:hypothetical protein ACYSUO_37080 [Streptomyces sp. UC4497]